MITLYSSEYIEVYFIDGCNSDFSLIAFSPSGVYADGENLWAESLARKINCPLISIMAKGPNWFPPTCIELCVDKIKKVLKSNRTILYGSSMGAYAALKYSRLFGATEVLAFNPQASINSKYINDVRFNKYFNKIEGGGDILTERNCHGMIHIFYDPYFIDDLPHINKIREIIPAASYWKMPACGHSLVYFFANSDLFSLLLRYCFLLDHYNINKLVNQTRRRSRLRPRTLAEAVYSRHPNISWRIFEKYSNGMHPVEKNNFYNSLITKEKNN